MTGWGRMGGGGEGRGREWMREWIGKENNGLLLRRRRESEGGENRDEKIVMAKLIV
jgi:hypothetical protein